MPRAASHPAIGDALITSIYDAAVGARDWTAVLDDLRKLFGACAAVFATKHAGGGSGVQVGVDPDIMRLFFERHAGRNPLAVGAASAPVGAIMTDRSGMPKADFVRTDFYGECLRPQGMHALMNLRVARGGRDGATVADFCIVRDRRSGEFEAEDIKLLGRFAPHLQRAATVAVRLTQAEAERHALMEALDRLPWAALVLDEAGTVQFANAAGSALLAAGNGLRAAPGSGGLLAAHGAETAALRRMIAAALPIGRTGEAGHLRLSRPPPHGPLIVTAVPLRAAAAAMVGLAPALAVLLLAVDSEATAPCASPAQMRMAFGLTEAETAVALRVGRGDDMPAAAVALGVSLATVRTHLHRIFDKTGTHRQAELAALLARLGPAEKPGARRMGGDGSSDLGRSTRRVADLAVCTPSNSSPEADRSSLPSGTESGPAAHVA